MERKTEARMRLSRRSSFRILFPIMIKLTRLQRLGRVELSLPAVVTVGSYQDFVLIYHAGFFGIDDSGSIKICYRYATDMGTPQFEAPDAANYVSVSSTADVTLVPRFDTKANVRPWGKTIHIRVTNGYLTEGDRIEVRFGDRSAGSPGFRMQTFCEASLEFRVLADVFACYRYEQVPAEVRAGGDLRANEVRLTAAEAVARRGRIPSTLARNEEFSLRVRGEDMWGNPAPIGTRSLRFEANLGVEGLSERVDVPADRTVFELGSLRCREDGILRITASTGEGEPVSFNPSRVEATHAERLYWGDLHGQSEETIGTNGVDDYFSFARDLAWLDVASHQGNDFQITREFWETLQETTCRYNEPGRFVTFPGYEWSANTGLGGDHNVYFLREGETIHRSCHALIDDTSDVETDCNRIDELFRALSKTDAMVFAHVGGRYADLSACHSMIRRSVEIHSAWGTFEWLLDDAFALGHRVGVVCNSDGHKGRPGASHPGASLFGAYGGLTGIYAGSLTREAIWEAYRRRRHYGTTGARMLLSVTAEQDTEGTALGAACETTSTVGDCNGDRRRVGMGDIVAGDARSARLCVEVSGTAPIERVELRNGTRTVETIRPYDESELGRRIRVLWAGAAFRGRGRQIDWDGGLRIEGNTIEAFEPINFYNPDRGVTMARDASGGTSLSWRSFTTGGVSGVILTLAEYGGGTMSFSAGPIEFELPIDEVGSEDRAYSADGIGVRVAVARLPDVNTHVDFACERVVALEPGRDNPLYVCVAQEDGHMAWSSPIYFVVE